MIHDILARIVRHEDLNRDEAAQVMRVLMTGEATSSQIGALLTAFSMKGETVEEIVGFAETMRALSTRIPTKSKGLVDTCGTGGDHAGTFNISTAAAFVVAGAGVHVAKHGNRSASSLCGSADVLEALGVNLDVSPERVGACVDEIGIGFLFARSLHSAMKHVGPTRAELKLRTVFNVLGPLTNPAGAEFQVVGVFDKELIVPLAHVLLQLGSKHVFIVAGSDGLDELTLTGPSYVAEGKDGAVTCYEVEPGQFGLPVVDAEALKGGDAATNAIILRAILSGEEGPPRDIVVLNAAPALVASGKVDSLAAGIEVARAAIDSGAAMDKLEQLIKRTHDS